jgi:hypothetical protein
MNTSRLVETITEMYAVAGSTHVLQRRIVAVFDSTTHCGGIRFNLKLHFSRTLPCALPATKA